MLHKKWIAVVLLSTAAVSTTASADNRGVNTAVGAVLGAVIGNSVGGQDGAVVGGVLGAVVGATASSGRGRDYDRRYAGPPQRYYREPYREPVYYQPAPQGRYYRDGYGYRDGGYYRDQRRVEYRQYDRYERDYYRR